MRCIGKDMQKIPDFKHEIKGRHQLFVAVAFVEFRNRGKVWKSTYPECVLKRSQPPSSRFYIGLVEVDGILGSLESIRFGFQEVQHERDVGFFGVYGFPKTLR